MPHVWAITQQRRQSVALRTPIRQHALVTVRDIHEYLKAQPTYADVLPRMEAYMRQYCVLD